MAYSEKVIDHYENPRNVGAFDKDDKSVATGMVGAPATYGCGSAIASSSLVTEWVKGKSLEEATQITRKEISAELELPPVKIHCSILAEDAIKAAIDDYKSKNA